MDNMKIPDKQTIEMAMRFAQSEDGQRLLASLQRSNDPNLKKVMQAGEAGDQAQLQKNMQALLSSPQIRQLLKQLGDNHG